MPLDIRHGLGHGFLANGVARGRPGRGFRHARPSPTVSQRAFTRIFPPPPRASLWIQPEKTLLAFVQRTSTSRSPSTGFPAALLLLKFTTGSNPPGARPFAARKTVIETSVYLRLGLLLEPLRRRINEHRKSEIGGIAHAGEFRSRDVCLPASRAWSTSRRLATPEPARSRQPLFSNLGPRDKKVAARTMLMRWWCPRFRPTALNGADPTVADPRDRTPRTSCSSPPLEKNHRF